MQNRDNSLSNLRDHMANERTFLSWVRTSIAIMAFGFVVEKFSIFLKQIALVINLNVPNLPKITHPFFHGYSKIFGIILVVVGALIPLVAFFKYKKTEQQINLNNYQPTILLDTLLTIIMVMVGFFLSIYLLNII